MVSCVSGGAVVVLFVANSEVSVLLVIGKGSTIVLVVLYSDKRSINSFSSRCTLRFDAIAGRISSLRSLCFFIPCFCHSVS